MKIRLTLPGGGMFEYQREPMSDGRFYAVCCVIGGAMVLALFLAMILK